MPATRFAGLAAMAALVAACNSASAPPQPTPSAPSPAIKPAGGVPVTAPPPTPVGSSIGASPCGPPDVAVDVSGEGATGSILLIIDVTNRGAAPCSLSGAPASIGLRAGGGNLPVTYQPRSDPWPGTAPDTVAPAIELPPNWKARARAVWSNWCGGRADVSTVWVGLATEAIDAHPALEIQPPRCDVQGAESTVQAFPFEEDTSGG